MWFIVSKAFQGVKRKEVLASARGKINLCTNRKGCQIPAPAGVQFPMAARKSNPLKKSIAIGEEFVKYIRASPYIAPAPLSE